MLVTKTIKTTIVAATVVFLSVSAYAQSDETCVAYMEADAAYESAVNRDEDVVKSSWESISASNAWLLAVGEVQNLLNLQREAENHIEARRLLREVEKALETSFSAQEASINARKKYEKSLAGARAKLNPARDSAYRAAYGGLTSDVDSVMNKLIAADRERCRERLETVIRRSPPDGAREERTD